MKKEVLREWRKSTKFFCPQCSEEVYLKVGEINIPHFAHGKEASCTAAFSEGESKEHLLGKEQLYELLSRFSKKVTLEPYVKELAQRPDLLVETKKAIYPIEFQCSTISIPQIEKRTIGFEDFGMKPIWILYTPEKLKKVPQGIQKMHFSRFEESLFTNTSPEGLVLLTYDPLSQQFHYFTSLQHIVGRQYIGTHRILPIAKQTFPFARPKTPTSVDYHHYYRIFRQLRSTFLHQTLFRNRRGINHPFLRQCYELRVNPSNLPDWVGVPIPFQNPFVEHPCEWQLAFIYYAKRERKAFQQLTKVDIEKFSRNFKGPFEHQLQACLKYQRFLSAFDINGWDKTIKLEENKILTYLSSLSLQSEVKIEKM